VVSLLNQPISSKKSLIESFPYLIIHYYIFSLPRNGELFNIWDSIHKRHYSRLSRSFYEVGVNLSILYLLNCIPLELLSKPNGDIYVLKCICR
jgi:hypothetical protein